MLDKIIQKLWPFSLKSVCHSQEGTLCDQSQKSCVCRGAPSRSHAIIYSGNSDWDHKVMLIFWVAERETPWSCEMVEVRYDARWEFVDHLSTDYELYDWGKKIHVELQQWQRNLPHTVLIHFFPFYFKLQHYCFSHDITVALGQIWALLHLSNFFLAEYLD